MGDDPEALYQIGVAHYEAERLEKAAEAYAQAAEQGHAGAQSNLGYMHYHGMGVAVNLTRAVELYSQAAEQRYAPAQCNLGFMYYHGQGVAQDQARGLALLKLAAAQGDERAQEALAKLGAGTPADATAARKAVININFSRDYNPNAPDSPGFRTRTEVPRRGGSRHSSRRHRCGRGLTLTLTLNLTLTLSSSP